VASARSGVSGDDAFSVKRFYGVVPTVRAKPFWLFLGRIHVKKGVDLLIEAYAQLAAELGESSAAGDRRTLQR